MNLDFNVICRLCLRFCEKYVDLNQKNGVKTLTTELTEKIKYCYLIQMDLSEELPAKVCYECIQVISFFYVAKKNVIISEQLLRDVLFVRKKLQDEAKTLNPENVTESKIIKLKPEEQKTSPSLINMFSEPCDNACNVKLTYNDPKQNYLSNNNCKENTSASNKFAVNFKENNNTFKLKKKKKYLRPQENQDSELRNSLNKPTNKSDNSLKLMDFKKLRCQPKRNSKSGKAEREAPRTESSFEEYVVKEIGTVIDTSNILSPDVKRARKSVFAT